MKLSELFLNRFLYRDWSQDSETKDSSFVSTDSSEVEVAAIPSGGAAADVNTGNVMIDSANIPSTVINAGDYGWTQSCTFSSTDLNTVSWGAGTFLDSAGNSYSISAGNTGNMTAKTYIYLSLLESETVYQTSTTSSDSVGTGKVLIAVAKNESDAATYNLVEANQIVGDNILVNTIDAGKIVAGSLIVGTNVAIGTAEDAAGVTTIVGNTVTTSYVNALDITATGQITAGSMLIVNGVNTIGFTPAGANAIFAGPTGSPTFYVTPAGALTATSVTITGDVTATAGSDWTGNSIAAAYIGNLDASKITTGSLTVTRTDAKCTDANADQTSANTAADTSAVNGLASSSVSGWAHGSDTTKIDGGDIYTNTVTATQIYVTSLSALSANVGTLTSGIIQGVTFKTSASGSERIELTGDNLIFYSGSSIKATVDGTTAGSGGVRSTGDWFTANNRSYWIASSAGGSTQYGGIGINSSNQFWMTLGTGNTLYCMNNGQSSQLFSLSTSSFRFGGPSYTTIHFTPYTTNTQDLGTSSYNWNDVYCNTVGNASGNAIWFDQSGRVQVDNHFDPSGTGSYNLGGSTRYWADVSYKTLTDRGCLGWFDDGVELQDGRIVSDMEALQIIQKHPTKKTVYGKPMLDYKTFPKVSYKKAADHEGKEYLRDKNDEPYIKNETDIPADGIEMTSVFSIMIGALKELDNRLKIAEKEIELLKNK